MKIQPTNRPKIGLDGYCKGTITKIELLEENDELKATSLKWTVESEGVLRPMTHHFFTPPSYNVDLEVPEEDPVESLPVFESFADNHLSITANILKQIGLLTEEMIQQLRSGEVALEGVEFDLEEIYGVPLRYKFVRVNSAYRINRATIERLTD